MEGGIARLPLRRGELLVSCTALMIVSSALRMLLAVMGLALVEDRSGAPPSLS
jgi:hypothetical protein